MSSKANTKKNVKKAIGLGIGLSTAGAVGVYYIKNKNKNNISKISEIDIKNEIKKLEKFNADIDYKYSGFGTNILYNLANNFNIPVSPVPILQRRKYDSNSKRISILKIELDKRINDLKSILKNIELEIKLNEKIINDRLWNDGYLVYNGLYEEPEESIKYNEPYREKIDKLKKSSEDIFSKIKFLE